MKDKELPQFGDGGANRTQEKESEQCVQQSIVDLVLANLFVVSNIVESEVDEIDYKDE